MSNVKAVSAGQEPVKADRRQSNEAARIARRRRLSVLAGQIGLFVVIFGGWQLFTAKSTGPLVDSFYYGRPWDIVKRLWTYFDEGTQFGSYWAQIGVTLEEALLGFVVGTVVGVVLGVLLGQSRYLADVLGPYIKVVNAIPRILLGSIFVVAFGFGLLPKVLLAAVLVFFIVFFNAFQGVREVDPNVVANARVLGASKKDIVRHVTIPSALTWIIASMHTALGFAIIGALVQEVLGAQKGLGLVVKTAQGNFDPNGVFAVILTVAAVVLVAEYLITLLERQLLSWRPPSPSESPSV